MTYSLCRKRKLAESFIPCVDINHPTRTSPFWELRCPNINDKYKLNLTDDVDAESVTPWHHTKKETSTNKKVLNVWYVKHNCVGGTRTQFEQFENGTK